VHSRSEEVFTVLATTLDPRRPPKGRCPLALIRNASHLLITGSLTTKASFELGSLRNLCAISRLLRVLARRPRSYYADASAQKLPFSV
jgi:hypothetical protein